MMSKISEYYNEHSQTVFRYLKKLCGSDELAEELTQETFYQAIRTLDRYRGECKPSVWLCQIARHCWYKHLEKNKHLQQSVPIDYKTDIHSPSPEDMAIDELDRVCLYEKMQELNGDQREVLYLRILAELSFKDIGMIMKRSENWARVTFFRAKTVLKEKCQ